MKKVLNQHGFYIENRLHLNFCTNVINYLEIWRCWYTWYWGLRKVWGCDRVIWSKWDQKGFKMSPVLGGRL